MKQQIRRTRPGLNGIKEREEESARWTRSAQSRGELLLIFMVIAKQPWRAEGFISQRLLVDYVQGFLSQQKFYLRLIYLRKQDRRSLSHSLRLPVDLHLIENVRKGGMALLVLPSEGLLEIRIPTLFK